MTPRDAEFCARVAEVVALYTRPVRDDEMVLSVEEKTPLQTRPRLHATRPAISGRPNQVEHEHKRDGALNLFAGFDIPREGSTGNVISAGSSANASSLWPTWRLRFPRRSLPFI
jgi:hypothetical protein